MNQDNIKTIATYFELGMVLGIEEKSRIANWVDSLIKGAPDIQDWMLTLSLISQVHPTDIVSILSKIEGRPDFHFIFKLISARLGQIKPRIKIEDAPFLQRLYRLIDIGGIPSEDKAYIYQIDNDLDYALENIVDFSVVEKSYQELVAIGLEERNQIAIFDRKAE